MGIIDKVRGFLWGAEEDLSEQGEGGGEDVATAGYGDKAAQGSAGTPADAKKEGASGAQDMPPLEGTGKAMPSCTDPYPNEEQYLIWRSETCPACSKGYKILSPRSGKVRRLQSEKDLRPVCEGIDILKYNLHFCPECGYSRLSIGGTPNGMSSWQRAALEEQPNESIDQEILQEMFDPDRTGKWAYGSSILLHKASLEQSITLKLTAGEVAYNHLVLAWLYRAMEDAGIEAEDRTFVAENAQHHYEEAFHGMQRALSNEYCPICGMDEATVRLLIAAMAVKLGERGTASQIISGILLERRTPEKIKDRARDLKADLSKQM